MDLNKLRVRRSFIFTPGLQPEMFPKALASGADMVCIELEDGIAMKDKDEARKNTIEALKSLEVKNDVELVVRLNCQRTKNGLLDLEAIASNKLKVKAIMLPKVKTPDEITFIDDMLTDCGLDTDLHVIMETNQALESIYDIALSSKRIAALFFGGVDMAADLRCENTWENLLFARSKIVHAAASAGIDVLDVPYLDLENMDGMKKEAILAKNLGFSGKGSIHPKQIKILNDVFTPSETEIKQAEKIVDEFEKSKTLVAKQGIDIVWETDLPEAKAIHLHPKQTGGAILSLDWMNPRDSWKWAGPDWEDHISGPISGVDGVEIQSDNPQDMFDTWSEVLGNPKQNKDEKILYLDNTWLKFISDLDGRGSGVSAFSLKCNEVERIKQKAEDLKIIHNDTIYLGGMKFYLV